MTEAPRRSGQRLMAVHAHPDDESSKGAATMAKYVAEGADVLVCTMTGGERGDILNPAMDRPGVRRELPRLRREEMDRAREILGIRQRFLGFLDSGLFGQGTAPPEGSFAAQDPVVAARPLVHAIREFRPHVLVTYDTHGGYPHPDHVMTHRVAVEAFAAAGDASRHPGAGDPWQPSKLYYITAFSKAYFTAIHQAMTESGLDSPAGEVLREWDDSQATWVSTTRVECADYFPIRRQAQLAHRTQVDPNGPALACPLSLEQLTWPTEDYHLAVSRVRTDVPEDDLFAGIAVERADLITAR
ncbi:mycothiol conjugate amidase Mca [Actinopolymorpha pittospori]|uniref:Mycothiol S-conjugate amidase n=1 Tax=Actinopolymorpha pittospori TaxID=648752 RepID=A0A927MUV8_9ACTN|nr:mycothiol conjugate amidase Mca [Actinopolymorpha pittospori]MBE1607311.1 mycothiol S-conjugate amidase [Actinopolymorpha pittospori]